MLQAVLIDNAHRSHAKINRQPCRLEIAATHTKQKPATQINRQQIATSRITHPSISNRHNQHAALWTAHRRRASPITTHKSPPKAFLIVTTRD
jgi:hypothetical protein